MKNITLLLLIMLFIFINGCANNTFNEREINNPRKIELPIDSANEAIQYSLSLDQVKSELNKPLDGSVAQYNKYNWWADSYKLDSNSYGEKQVWAINWFKGPGECQSPYGCQILIASDGTPISNLSCHDGWNCK